GGILTQGQQLPGSSSDWNVAQNFVSVRSSKGQVVVVSNEVPLWQFSDFNMGKFERYPKQGLPWLYSWVMNNYWFTNFRAYQEGTFSWSYQLTSTNDTTNAFATKFAWGERNPFATRTLPAGENKLCNASLRTLKIDGPENVLVINIRPSFHKKSIILHLRELEGLPADIKLSPADQTLTIKKVTEINSLGERTGQPISAIRLKPYEVKFIEVEI
ncbi:MAG TPA: glycosyl hydrolase family 38, partial [Petrimonas sp.]|nr:glycosyl hydrolase family 38 [Petrimonas sp.]